MNATPHVPYIPTPRKCVDGIEGPRTCLVIVTVVVASTGRISTLSMQYRQNMRLALGEEQGLVVVVAVRT
jgi:hypothetical protein